MDEQKYNKESIMNRMIHTAMDIWNIDKFDNFDPLVRLLIETLASEIYTLSDDMVNIEVRLLNKLAEVLIPRSKTTALPAHAIAMANPLESEFTLSKNSSLKYEDLIFNKKQNIDNINFSPIFDVNLKKGKISHLFQNGCCFSVGRRSEKKLLDKYYLPDSPGLLWIALDMDLSIQSLANTTFYFDFPNTTDKDRYTRLIPFTSWTANGQVIRIKEGCSTNLRHENRLMKVLEQHNIMTQINRDIYNLYKSGFITIVEDFSCIRTKYPLELKEAIVSSSVLAKEFDIPRLWLNIQFPSAYLPERMEDMTVSINAFPVVQKTLKQKSVTLSEFMNIVPLSLKMNEYLLSVNSVMDSFGRIYLELSNKNDANMNEKCGSYSIRHGGCERFDTRNAKDYLLRLIDLLNEEAAMFTSVSNDKVTDMTEEALQLINRMELMVADIQENRDITDYLIMDCPFPKEIITAKYWTTNGLVGNGIKSGTALTPDLGTEIDPHGSFLLTTTTGGRKPLMDKEKINQFKSVLTSKNRIITTEDIRDYCLMEFVGIITDVTVKRGIAVSDKPHGGLVRTIDIEILTSHKIADGIDKEEIRWKLISGLTNRSPESYNYRIIL